ncbi:hypothetical protein BT69DRAFT_1281313 [Atractiella rhizophila]|nr:hypothetical protein BT69DRAFT_1281313 [Atractiella rhizophila]
MISKPIPFERLRKDCDFYCMLVDGCRIGCRGKNSPVAGADRIRYSPSLYFRLQSSC